MKENTGKKKWTHTRHRVVTEIIRPFIHLYVRLRYGMRVEKFREQEDRPYLILLNHQTPFDQFFVGLSMNQPIYFMATEDIFSMGWISDVIRWLLAPIPIKKQTTDVSAVMTCIRVAREGGTIAIAPEGNRTYSGRTQYMNPAIAGLAKKLQLPILLYRIEGGYGAEPRWSNCIRRGRVRGYVSRVIRPEEYGPMSREELMAVIEEGLAVDEGKADGIFRSGKRAEYLERVVYICPDCGPAKFESRGCRVRCCSCGKTITYGEDKTLSCPDGEFPFRFLSEWYDYQEAFVNSLELSRYFREPMFRDRARLSEVIVYKRKNILRPRAEIALYGDRVVIDEGSEQSLTLPFAQLSAVVVLGRNKLNLYHDHRIYQLKGSRRLNALKYVHIYHRYKNISRGDTDGKFLGL